jgi:hypothetical protein
MRCLIHRVSVMCVRLMNKKIQNNHNHNHHHTYCKRYEINKILLNDVHHKFPTLFFLISRFVTPTNTIRRL